MKQYIGTKIIKAKPMTRGDYNDYRGQQIPEDENPADKGYLMEYENRHVQWLPEEMFEADYIEYDKNKLPATAISMISPDYKERFKAEYNQLVIRYEGLHGMLKKWDDGTLEFEPTCSRSIYNMQIRAMSEYIVVLEARAAIEKVDLMSE